MSLDTLPTRTTGSLGPVKVDEAPPPDDVRHISAAEWNAAMDLLVELSTRLGLGDGTTVPSIERALRSLNAPGSGEGRWTHVEDFIALNTDAEGDYETSVSGSGSIDGIQDASSSPASASGFGWLQVGVESATGFAVVLHRGNPIRVSAHAPIELKSRVFTPSTPSNTRVAVGFYESASGASQFLLRTTAGGAWEVFVQSAVGGASETIAVESPALDAGEPADVHLVLNGDSTISVYIDGEQATLASTPAANAVPTGTDILSWEFFFQFLSDSGGNSGVDYFEVSGARP